jgi:hypothetical protein
VDNDAIRQADAVALADRVDELLTRVRCAEAELGAVLVDIEDRSVAELFGYRSVARLLEELADVSPDAARKLVRRVQASNPSHRLGETPCTDRIPARLDRTGQRSGPQHHGYGPAPPLFASSAEPIVLTGGSGAG